MCRSSDPIHIRLNAEAERLRQEQIKREQKRIEDESKEATFTPNLQLSRAINQQSVMYDGETFTFFLFHFPSAKILIAI